MIRQQWQVSRTLQAPVAGAPKTTTAYPVTLVVSLQCGLGAASATPTATPDLTRVLRQALQLPELTLQAEIAADPASLPPRPWAALPLEPAPDESRRALLASLRRAWKLDLEPVNRQLPPLNALLEQSSDTLREAFGFALLNNAQGFDRHNPLWQDWFRAVERVLWQRELLHTVPETDVLPVRAGYALLTAISKLRAATPDLRTLEASWEALAQADWQPWPQAFAIAYWGMATLRLTETRQHDAAATTLARQQAAVTALTAQVPGLAEPLRGGLWLHQVGRQAYYAGDFATALTRFTEEWRVRRQHPAEQSIEAELRRSFANCFSDLGVLDAAERMAAASEQQLKLGGNQQTRYRTLGRLGEIALRQGKYDLAEGYLMESQAIQDQLSTTTGRVIDGQTSVYLGHAALLRGNDDNAEIWYSQSRQDDLGAYGDDPTRAERNPYRVMGELALASRRGYRQAVRQLWQTHAHWLQQLRGVAVLPRAVAALAAHLANAQDPLPDLAGEAERLLGAYYYLEALPLLRVLHAAPADAEASLLRLRAGLQGWQTVLTEIAADLDGLLDLDNEPMSPGRVSEVIDQALAENDWAALADWTGHIYPVNLVDTGQAATAAATTSNDA